MVNFRARRSAGGFTLIELLVVLAILTMLAGLVGPRVLNQLGVQRQKQLQFRLPTLTNPWSFSNSTWAVIPQPKRGLMRSSSALAMQTVGRGRTSKEACQQIHGGAPTAMPIRVPTVASRSCPWAPTALRAAKVKMPTSAIRREPLNGIGCEPSAT